MPNRIFYFLVFVLMVSAIYCQAQGKKSLADAEHYFSVRSYDVALPKFLESIAAGEKDPMVYYKTGVCYQKSPETDEQIKSIPYFEYALKNGKDMPASLHYDLGAIYLKDEKLQQATDSFNKFKSLSSKADKKAMTMADEAIQICNNAVALMSVPRNFKVTHFSSIINSKFTEYNPVVSADESVMAFTALRPNTGKTRTGDKFIEEIYITENHNGSWTEPKSIPIASEYNLGTAGISADGQKMLIFMGGAADPGSLFQITRAGDVWSKPSLITPSLNTPKYLESTASITPDGKTIYFASDRLGGQGAWTFTRRACKPITRGRPRLISGRRSTRRRTKMRLIYTLIRRRCSLLQMVITRWVDGTFL